jgi:KDO2-lipid IV(A) lauroyltransferase
LVPARTERLKGARFRITVYPPLELPATGDRSADERAIMVTINQIVENWIRDRPEQWLWLHRRWPD